MNEMSHPFTGVDLGHGLYYISRDTTDGYQLDKEAFPYIDQPERDVLRALLGFALEKLSDAEAAAEDHTWD